MDSLFNRNTNDVASNESTSTEAMPQYAVSDAPATVINPLHAGESAGEHAASANSPAATSDACAYVAEPAPQQAIPTKECDGKQPGRAANLLLVATLAAVCGLAGGLAGGAIMSAATGGSTQAAQGGMGGGAQGADGTTGNSEGAANGSAPSGQAPTGAPDASGSSDASADGSTGESSNGAPSDAPADAGDSSATSQTSLSA